MSAGVREMVDDPPPARGGLLGSRGHQLLQRALDRRSQCFPGDGLGCPHKIFVQLNRGPLYGHMYILVSDMCV